MKKANKFAVVTFTICALILACAIAAIAVQGSTDTARRCTEDMACWDCATMGNMICGTP